MDEGTWYRRRVRAYLFVMGLKRRMTLGSRGVLIEDGRVYLIRHTYAPGWHFPGGGIEPGESLEQGLAREVGEESGYRLTGRPELFGIYHNVQATNRDHVALYLCREFELARTFVSNFEIAEFGWFSWDALPEAATAATRRRVQEIFAGEERGERW
jgi:8-oxo-dGTP pyrophosphatase MutT (NUDIX family)